MAEGSDPIRTPEGEVNEIVVDRPSFDIGKLSAQVEQANRTLEEQRDAYAADKQQSKDEVALKELDIAERNRRWRAVVIGALLLGGVGVVAGLMAFNAADTAQTALDEIVDSRTTSRRTACNDANDQRIAHNRLVLDLAGFDPETGLPTETWSSRDPATLAELRPRLVRNLVGLRLCADEQIEAFYASNRQEGVVPIDSTEDDFSEAVTAP